MIEQRIQALVKRYVPLIAASKSDREGVAHYLNLVREVAKARAAADFLIYETEAERCLATEDHGALKDRLLRSIADQRAAIAGLVADAADHAADDVERRRYGQYAAESYQKAFDALVATVRGAGRA